MSGLNRGQEIVREMIVSRISSLNYIIENDKKNDWNNWNAFDQNYNQHQQVNFQYSYFYLVKKEVGFLFT